MSKKADIMKMRMVIFIIGGLIVALICVAIFIFSSSYDHKDNLLTIPLQSEIQSLDSSMQNKKNKQAIDNSSK